MEDSGANPFIGRIVLIRQYKVIFYSGCCKRFRYGNLSWQNSNQSQDCKQK